MTISALPGKIAFLVKTYPKLSETFILGEIIGLEKRGLNLHIFALQRPTDQIFHQATKQVNAPCEYLAENNLHNWLSHCRVFLTHPLRYIFSLLFALLRTESGGLSNFHCAVDLVQRLKASDVQHLHTHFINRPAAIAELVHHLTAMPFSISAHAKDIYLSSPTTLRRKINKAMFTVTCSEYNRHHLTSLASDNAIIHRMYHGIDLEQFSPNFRANKAPPLILSVGRLREKKGFETLIRACAELQQQGISFRCKIVGYGPDEDRLKDLVNKLALGHHVELTGALTHETLIDLYGAACVFVLPCQITDDGDRDGIPNVLLEAMAMQLPVITTPISGIPEVIEHQRNGLLVSPQSPLELANVMQSLFDDFQLRYQLGAAARLTIVQSFSNEKNLTLLCDLLKSESKNIDTATAFKEHLHG